MSMKTPVDVAETVKSLVVKLYRHLRENEADEVRKLYDGLMSDQSVMFTPMPWPSVDDVAPLVDYHAVVHRLYRELFHRHIFATTPSPTLQQRIDSYLNYRFLFQRLSTSGLFTPFPLPHRWLWDMLDEFVNQFQSFCQCRADAISSEPEYGARIFLQEFWCVERVLEILQSLIDESSINDILYQANDGVQLFPATDDEDHSGRSNVLKVMGYFSMVALLRVHCLLGNYLTGLACLQPIDTRHQGFYTTLIDAHVTTIYHYGFANIMSHRHVEGVRVFSKFLAYLESNQLQQMSPQIPIKIEQMYALLAICLALCPLDISMPIDENVNSQLMQRYRKKMSLMRRYDARSTFLYAELLAYAWPTYNTSFAATSSDPRLVLSKTELFKDKDRLPSMYPYIFTPDTPLVLVLNPLVNNIKLRVVVEILLKSRWEEDAFECSGSNFRKRFKALRL